MKLPLWSRRLLRFLLGLLLLAAFVAAALINAPGLVALYYDVRYTPLVQALPEAALPKAGQRLLVLAPHPDDEVLCCAGTILQALTAGAEVYVVWLTNGDGFEWDAVLSERRPRPQAAAMRRLGLLRMLEARRAAAVLGVPETNLFFLGYPDRGTLRLLLDHYLDPYRSRYTGVSEVPYPGTLHPGAPYTGRSMESDLREVLVTVNPDMVLAPSPLDAHPDHQALAYLALRVLGNRDEESKLRYWMIHGGVEWPLPKGLHPKLPLFPPPRGRDLAWRRVSLSEDEVATKERATRAHASQMRLLFRYLEAFARENELLSLTPLPPP